MPDWRKPDNYPSPDDLNNEEWAWEFLRRNPTYRKEWENLRRAPPPEKDKGGGYARAFNKFTAWGLMMPCNPDLSAIALRREKGQLPKGSRASHDDRLLWKKELISVPMIVLGKDSFDTLAQSPEGVEFLSFNLYRPIDPQLKEAERLIKDIRDILEIDAPKAATKAHRGKFPFYLRALDAELEGTLLKEIAAVLFGGAGADRKAHNNLKQAQHYRDGGYWNLIALD